MKSDKQIDPSKAHAQANGPPGSRLGPLQLFAVLAAIGILGVILWNAASVLLLILAGALLGVFLHSLAQLVRNHSPLGHGWSLAVTVAVLLGVFVLLGWLLAPKIEQQVEGLRTDLTESVAQLREEMRGTGWGNWLLTELHDVVNDPPPMENLLMRHMPGVFNSTLGVLGGFLIIIAVGLYFAATPSTYRAGILHLIPPTRRTRAAEVLESLYETMQWWIWSKMLGMLIIGALTTFGLMLLGIPMALTLGMIAALLTFIPNFGPILASIPGILLGLVVSPMTAVYVACVYLGVQFLESYVITPMIARRTISMPPALMLSSQMIMGSVFGALGLVLAVPLTASVMVLARMLYVKDAPGESEGCGRDENVS